MTATARGDQARMVGRRSELSEIDASLHATALGHGRALAISGELGVGKIRLVRVLAERAAELGYLVLRGKVAGLENDLPSALMADTLDQLPVGPRLERYEYAAIRSMLEESARITPPVLIFDDAQRGDRASVGLICRLLRRRPAAPYLLVVTHRRGPPSEPLTKAITTAARNGELTRLELSPLRFEEAALLCGDLPPVDRVAVYHESGGNPFYLEQLAHARRTGRESEVPPMVRLAIADELGALSLPGRSVLRVGAAVGDVMNAERVAEVVGISENDAKAAIDELIARDLLRADGAPGRALFRHPVVRQAVYQSTDDPSRRAIHERAGAMLQRRGAPVTDVARRLEHSAQIGDQTAIARLVSAAERDAPGAPLAAARWYRAAVRLLPDDAELPRKVALVARLAEALARGGSYEEAEAVLRSALALVRSNPWESRAPMVACLARVSNLIGRAGDLRTDIERALTAVRDDRLACELELWLDYWTSCEWAAMARRTSSALRRAHALDDRALTLRAAAGLALAEMERGAVGAAMLAADEARASVARASDAEIAASLEAVIFLGLAEVMLERRSAVIGYLERGRAVARATRQSRCVVALAAVTAMAQIYAGELAAADETLDTAVEISDSPTDEGWSMWTAALQCWTVTLRGDAARALSAGRDAIDVQAHTRAPFSARWGRCFLGRALIEAGDPEAGRARILDGGGGAKLPLLAPSVRSEWYASLTEAELALGHMNAADSWATRAEVSARALPTPGTTACAQLARASLEFARGGFERAAELAQGAAASFDGIEQPLDAARARTLTARALAAVGATDQAIELLMRAASTLGSAGALRYHDDASRELRRLGMHPPAPASVPVVGVPLGHTEPVGARGWPARPAGGKLDAELCRSVFGGRSVIPPGPDVSRDRQPPGLRPHPSSSPNRSSPWPQL
jgi:tetratricopeptide (TPR) repeat protein